MSVVHQHASEYEADVQHRTDVRAASLDDKKLEGIAAEHAPSMT
jgi:hypothetical protein